MNTPRSDISRAEFLRRGALGFGMAATSALSPAQLLASTPPAPAMPTDHPIFDLREFERWIIDEFEPSVRRPGGAGHYARAADQPNVELYGVADMACVLYTLGRLQPSASERVEWAAAFQQFQREEDGWLREKDPSHGPLHNFAFALGGMELLDLQPVHPIRMAPEYADPRAFLATLDWKTRVYPDSHQGAGLGAVHALTPKLGGQMWMDAYFAACDDLFDPRNGLMGRDKPAGGDFDQVGGTFHYFFLYNYFNRHAPFPRQRIDAVLGTRQPNGYWKDDNKLWLTLDGLYLLTRTLRYCPHRYEDVVACARDIMGHALRDLFSPEGRAREFSKRLTAHSVLAAISIAAEAQQFLGMQEVVTERPLRLVLDRRPFI